MIFTAASGTSVLDVLAECNMQTITTENPAELILAAFLRPGVVGKEDNHCGTVAEERGVKMLQIRIDLLILLPFRATPAHCAALPAVDDGQMTALFLFFQIIGKMKRRRAPEIAHNPAEFPEPEMQPDIEEGRQAVTPAYPGR